LFLFGLRDRFQYGVMLCSVLCGGGRATAA
jgi:hypothetical protein